MVNISTPPVGVICGTDSLGQHTASGVGKMVRLRVKAEQGLELQVTMMKVTAMKVTAMIFFQISWKTQGVGRPSIQRVTC